MRKLTKTQRDVLAEAARNPYRLVSVSFGTQARRGFGKRRHNAVVALRDMGLLVRVSGDGGYPLYKHGYGINGRVYTSTWKLTDDNV